MKPWGHFRRRTLIRAALRERTRHHDNWPLRRGARWAYTAKAILCILTGRRRSLWTEDEVIDPVATWGWSSSPVDYGHDWWELAVGRGIFARWAFDVYWNGS